MGPMTTGNLLLRVIREIKSFRGVFFIDKDFVRGL